MPRTRDMASPCRVFSLIGLAALAIVLPLPASSFTFAYSSRGLCVPPCPLSLRSAPLREPNGVFSAGPQNARIRPMHMQHSSPSFVPVPVDAEVASIFASALSGQFSNAIQVEECDRKSESSKKAGKGDGRGRSLLSTCSSGFCRSRTNSLTHSLARSLAHAHTHTHSHSHIHTRTHTRPCSCVCPKTKPLNPAT
jgi:hypothetical protein